MTSLAVNRANVVQAVTWLAIELFYLMTFGLAAWLKWSQGMPGWFAKQFEESWLANAWFDWNGCADTPAHYA